MIKTFVFAAAALAATAVPSLALEVSRSAEFPGDPVKAWQAIGNFCDIEDWHPVVESCTLSNKDGKVTRTLELKGGGTIVERLVSWNKADHKYTYRIVKSPLPVKNYISTIKVVADGAGSDVVWSGKYDAVKGSTDDAAKKVIDGIYKAGADSLAQ